MPNVKSTKVKIPSKAPNLPPSAIKRGVSDDFKGSTPRQEESLDIDKALDAAGVFDEPEEVESSSSTNKESEAGAPPPVVAGEKPSEAGKAPPVVEKEPIKSEPEAKKGSSLKDPEAEKKAAEAEASAKKTPPVDPTKKVDEAPATPKDEELEKVQPPEKMSTAAKDNWEKLTSLAKDRGSKLKEVNTKYEQAVADINKLFKERGQIPDEVKKELDEHRQFRKLHDIENDVEFKKQYADKITENDKQLSDILLHNGMSQAEIDTMKAKGFMTLPMSHWEERVLKPLNDAGSPEEVRAAAVIKNLLEKNHIINHEMRQEVKKAGEGKSEYWNQREESKKKEVQEEQSFVEREVNQLQEKYPFLKMQEVPSNATPEQKQAIDKSNQYVGFLHGKFQEHYKPKTVSDKLNTAVAAVYAYIAEDQFVSLQQKYAAEQAEWQSKNDALEQQLEEIKKASMTSGAGESTPAKPPSINPVANIKKRNTDAIEEGLAEAEESLR